MIRKSIISERAPEAVGPYPHAKRVGNFLFVSGMGPRKKGSSEIPGVTLDACGKVIAHDTAVQCRSVFDNIRLILEDAGAKWEDIVDVTAFLTDIAKDFAAYNKVYAEYFPLPSNRPARTTVEVAALPTPIAIEVKVVAVVE